MSLLRHQLLPHPCLITAYIDESKRSCGDLFMPDSGTTLACPILKYLSITAFYSFDCRVHLFPMYVTTNSWALDPSSGNKSDRLASGTVNLPDSTMLNDSVPFLS